MTSADYSPGARNGKDRFLRAADTDREAVAERLRDAAGDGRISLDELEERLELAFTAKTYADLEPLLADLPEGGSYAPVASGEPLVVKAGSGNVEQTGYWVVPSKIIASSGMGSVKIDFTRAECRQKRIDIEVTVGMGNAVVVVPRGWEVQTNEVSSGMGQVTNRANDRPEPGAPVVRFTGRVRMGVLKVRYPSRFETARARRAEGR